MGRFVHKSCKCTLGVRQWATLGSFWDFVWGWNGVGMGVGMGLVSFSGPVWAKKHMETVVWGHSGSGAGFVVRGGGGWEAKVLLSCKRECKIHDSPWACFMSSRHLFSHPEIDVCGKCSRQLVPGLCLFQ